MHNYCANTTSMPVAGVLPAAAGGATRLAP